MGHTTATLTGMPSEVLAQIYSSLRSRKAVDSLSRTCRSLHRSSQDDAIWELYRHTIPGFPVSKEAAQKTFRALGDEWWKQLYDGKYHLFRDRVFDEGLHDGDAEPGFYNSALNAFIFINKHMGEEITPKLYLLLHQIICSHFLGKKNKTEMHAREAGKFRDPTHAGTLCYFDVDQVLTFFDQADAKDESRRQVIGEFTDTRSSLGNRIGNAKVFDQVSKYNRIIQTADALELETLLITKLKTTSAYLEQLKQDSILGKAYPHILLDYARIIVDYAEPKFNTFSFEEVIPHVFSEFNRSISEIDKELLEDGPHDRKRDKELINQKLELICALYQKLEWFHPFPDGQGRTDVMLLGMLLSKHGFTPAILDELYISSFAPLADWVDYLKEGMARWQQEVSERP